MDFIAPLINVLLWSLLAPIKIIKHPIRSLPYLIINCIIVIMMYNRVIHHLQVNYIDLLLLGLFFGILAQIGKLTINE
jgi:hypothetical protein